MAEPADRIFVSGVDEEREVNVCFDPDEGGTEYIKAQVIRDALPDKIAIYRAIKSSGARKHADIAAVVADLYTLKETE